MASSIRLPSLGASQRVTAVLTDFGAVFGMALILCLCGVLIACFEMVSAQMQSVAQAKAMAAARKLAAEQEFNARFHPLVDSKWFYFPTLQPPNSESYFYECSLPYLDLPAGLLPTADLCPMRPLYPVSFPAESYGPLPGNQ